MRIIAIETSCDETAICIIDVLEVAAGHREFRVLANETVTQIAMHQEYGGVFPTVAKREHARALTPLLVTVLNKASLAREVSSELPLDVKEKISQLLAREFELATAFTERVLPLGNPDINKIVVTSGPGLEPALWVGINFALALGLLWNIPVIEANHMEGHILAALFSAEGDKGSIVPITFPAVALLISGGHTELVLMKDWGAYELLGETKDDAVGEAFDKVARMMGLPYPGGPEISRIAVQGSFETYQLPRPMLHSHDADFSFSGLKTAVLYLIKKIGTLTEKNKADIARAFEDSVTEVLTAKTRFVMEAHGAKTLIVGGGVSANIAIRRTLTALAQELSAEIYLPAATFSTDNALMIALVGALNSTTQDFSHPIVANGNWKIHG